jgi:PucR family transcriptional regulator, purine catabolism regulatory protein
MSSTVSLAALLTHPALAEVQVLADGTRDPSDVTITQVVAATAPERLPSAEACLLVLLHPVDRGDWRIDVLLRRAAAIGAGALVIDGTHALARPTAMLASRLRLPVLGTDAPFAVATAARDLLAEEPTRLAAAMVGAARAISRSGRDLEDLTHELSRRLGREVHLLDQAAHALEDMTALDEDETPLVAQALGRQRATVRVPLPSGRTFVGALVPMGDALQTWIGVVLPGGLLAEEHAVAAALEVSAPAVGHRLALRRLADERDARHRAALLGEILEAEGTLTRSHRRRALEAGWWLDGWHVGIRLRPRQSIDTVARRDEVIAALQAEEVSVNVVEQTEGWTAWTTLHHEPTAAEIQRLATRVRTAQRRLARTLECIVGVGRVHPGPVGLTRSIAEAQDAAELATDRSSSGNFVHVDRLGLAQLLLAWTNTDTFLPAARALLEPLHGQPGHLLETLRTYLDAESSIVDTAAVLGVHRNTVGARVNRIQQLLAVDLTDPETRLALHLACRTQRLP